MTCVPGTFARLATIVLFAAGTARAAESGGFTVPDGFTVSLYAGDELAHDIYSMTVDSHGRVVVAGRGYVKILHDRDGDGRADAATLFAGEPRGGARGMYFDGNALICSGDAGFRRLADRDGDGVADGMSRVWARSTGEGDHAANGIVKGPDGWFYWICGNDAGIGPQHARLPGSPVKRPNCGALVRLSPDGKTSEVLAHGFRNPYDLDFNSLGQVFTYDADGERDQHLPWYSPTRVFDIAQGKHHGWVLKGWVHAWNRPPWIPDSVERLCEVGRGSPTGVIVYRHVSFPRRYRDGLFAACWSRGRIYFLPLERRDSTYRTRLEIFMQPGDDFGFAPVDLAVGTAGELFVAIGGRGTRGSVYRVRHEGAGLPAPPQDPLRAVLIAPQPLSSWSRARWVPAARQLGRGAFQGAATSAAFSQADRIRAVEILVELFGGVPVELARRVLRDAAPELRARTVWAVSRSARDEEAAAFLSQCTHDDDPRVLRAAWEALAALAPLEASRQASLPPPDWKGALEHHDRRIREAAVLAARNSLSSSFDQSFVEVSPPRRVLAYLRVHPAAPDDSPRRRQRRLRLALAAFEGSADPRIRLEAVRALQLELGDVELEQGRARVEDGFVARWARRVEESTRAEIARGLLPFFPGDGPALDRELARLFAMLAVDSQDLLRRMSALWTTESAVEDDIHYLLAAARIPGARPGLFTVRSAAALAGLHGKMEAAGKQASRFWPVRVRDAFDELRKRDPKLVSALLETPGFGRAEHALFVEGLPQPEKTLATRLLLERVRKEDSDWSTDLVSLVGGLPDGEGFDALREHWSDPGLRDAIARVLCRRPQEADRDRFVEALDSRQADVVTLSARALSKLGAKVDTAAITAAMRALKTYCSIQKQETTRAQLRKLLEHWTSKRFEIREGLDPHVAHRPWFDWFARQHPEEAEALAGSARTTAEWIERMDAIDWDGGVATRGLSLFRKQGCESCHGGQRLGPELRGVTTRFSARDLFLTVLEPNRDISPAYLPTEVLTRDGRVYSGLMVYQSPAATLLQTSADTTVRFTDREVLQMRPGRNSFMPSGLLDDLKDRDLADLYAYLKTLNQ